MKKLFALCLALVMALAMALTLCACGGSQISKDEMLENAESLDVTAFNDEYQGNKVKLTEQCEGKEQTVIISGYVDTIEADHITLENYILLDVYLPEEEIMELEVDQNISVVGIWGNIRGEAYPDGFGSTFGRVVVDLKPAYVENTVYSQTGAVHIFTVWVQTGSDTLKENNIVQLICNNNGWNYAITLDLTAEQKTSLTEGQEITVEGKRFYYSSSGLDSKSGSLMKDVIIK